jgi:NitT/TauT family transport system substrate-binding protein
VGTPREVRGVSAMATLSYAITSSDPEIKTIADLGKCKKIPVPSVKVSGPAVTIQMAAVKLYGITAFDRFDSLTITMSPADATVALLSGAGDVNCTVALPPFMQRQLEDPRVHTVATSFDINGGPTTYTIAYTSKKFHDQNPKLYQAVYEALAEATDRVASDIRTASRYWIEDSDSKLTIDFVAAAGGGEGVKWTMTPETTLKQAEFMYDVGTIKVKPKSWKDYFFPEAYSLPGG